MEALWLGCRLRSWAFAVTDATTNGSRAAAPTKSRAFVPPATVRFGINRTRKPDCLTRTLGTRSPRRFAKLGSR
jgi:hypothetical protein